MGITNPTEEYFKDGGWGWDGTRWRKLALVWGYTDRLAVRVDHTKVGAGDYAMDFAAVPAGEIWVLNTVVSRNSATASQQEYLLSDTVTFYPIFAYGTPAPNVFRMSGYLQFVMRAGDGVRIWFRACTNADVLTGEIWGYKMSVA